MGGIWGLASSSALENLPVEVRGLASGVLQQGYAVGYLIAAVINLTIVEQSRYTWRTLFWFGSGVTFFAAVLRACLPESEVFLRAKAIEKARGTTTTDKTKIFLHETKEMLKMHWKLCIYAVLLMTGKHPTVTVSLTCVRKCSSVFLYPRIQLFVPRFSSMKFSSAVNITEVLMWLNL